MPTKHSYYKLRPEWELHGWENVPHALVNRDSGQLIVLDKSAFFAASACDGETDFDLPIFLENHCNVRDKLLSAGIIEKVENPTPISEFQKYRKAPNPFYRMLHWSITGSCNLKCRHCYLNAPEKKYKDLTFQRITKLIDEMYEAGIMEVSVTGGEPFIKILCFFFSRKKSGIYSLSLWKRK